MSNKMISYRDENGQLVSATDVWTFEKLEQLFTKLNPKRLQRKDIVEREKENDR
ncbi:hypothetical protein [Streptococcus sciuri]|uniref:Extracellular protein n=1 Tax=Streptococcus sciuri TaxID=2973939 RepID=A0ABT2F7I1_9STRE|nr:hypothetical protein [Streptococcus sciuri]MCS4487991.1 hypothetical protein [Streptococcus sciuri]